MDAVLRLAILLVGYETWERRGGVDGGYMMDPRGVEAAHGAGADEKYVHRLVTTCRNPRVSHRSFVRNLLGAYRCV